MSSYNKKIIKSMEASNQQPVHINDRAVGTKEEYIQETVQSIIDQLVKETKEEIETEKERILSSLHNEREEAIAKGYEEGYLLGKEKAKEELRIELEEEFQKASDAYQEANFHLQKTHEEMAEQKKRWMEENKIQVAAFIKQSVELLLKKKIEEEHFDISLILEEAFSSIRDENEKVWVRLNPATYQQLKSKNIFERNVEWICDPVLGKADVEIETTGEFIDGKVQSKLAEIKILIQGLVDHD